MVIAGVTPPEWTVSIIDENLSIPDYQKIPRPDLVGLTAFTSQIVRAYELAEYFQDKNIPVVIGGIHATMRTKEVERYVRCTVTGEAENIWPQVLMDCKKGKLHRLYKGGHADLKHVPSAKQDVLTGGYALGAIQTTRGCPLNCSFCSVTAFNGAHYRQRATEDVVSEFKTIHEKKVLVVDDNMIGTKSTHIARAKELFRALIAAKINKEWLAQVTINFADDEELLSLAAEAGCRGVFIGFESITAEGLSEVSKKFNISKKRDFKDSVRRIQRHKIMVVGSFIIGLDADGKGIGQRIAETAGHYGLDNINVLFLTPLPGTQLWDQMKADKRIALNNYPSDWKYYTLTYPVAVYAHFSQDAVIEEMIACDRYFYSFRQIGRRLISSIWNKRKPFISLMGNITYRTNLSRNIKNYKDFKKRAV